LTLPEDDERYLAEKGFLWELQTDGQGACLVILGFCINAAVYNSAGVDLMVRIPAQYNLAGLDMFYVRPPLTLRATGHAPAAAEQMETHCGTQWQRFSRHLPSPWRPGVDGIATLLAHASRELQGSA
jgi:hypothetical protein